MCLIELLLNRLLNMSKDMYDCESWSGLIQIRTKCSTYSSNERTEGRGWGTAVSTESVPVYQLHADFH